MATKRKKWWQQLWVWIVAVPVVIVAVLTGSHQPHTTGSTAPDQAPSITITSTTTPPAVATTITTVVPTTTTTPPPPPPPPTTHRRTVAAPPPAPPVAPPPVVAPPVAAPPVADTLCGAPPNPLGYNYCGRGSLVVAPSPDTCSYFHCIDNWSNGRGHMEECKDGDVSMSGGIQGSCSYHGGNELAVYQG